MAWTEDAEVFDNLQHMQPDHNARACGGRKCRGHISGKMRALRPKAEVLAAVLKQKGFREVLADILLAREEQVR